MTAAGRVRLIAAGSLLLTAFGVSVTGWASASCAALPLLALAVAVTEIAVVHLSAGRQRFTFSLTGTNLQTLTSNSFLTALSTGTDSGDGFAAFSVRFRGFADGGSDKVTLANSGSGGGTGGGNGTPVPEPASMALLGMGLAGLGLVRRRAKQHP